jgi:two-component system, cell cycle sensor histidine kinase and response regulator CckA
MSSRDSEILNALSRTARDALLVTDADGRITLWSAAAEQIFGYPETAILGQPLSMLMPQPVLNRPVEQIARHRDGHQFPVEISLSSWNGAEGVFFCGTIRDISARRATATAAKMNAVGLLAGGIAHDFNNVITAIYGCTDVLLAELDGGSPAREHVTIIQDAARRAAGITRQLLAFSRRQIFNVAPVDVNRLVERLRPTLAQVLTEAVRIELRLAPVVPAIAVDESQIEQVFVNLAANARDAMAGGGRLVVETAVVNLDEQFAREHPSTRPGPHVLIAITDTGTGMDHATQERAFEPFFTTKGNAARGLGLSTVYGIVKQSGGSIWISSEPGRGTTIELYFPVAGDLAAAPTVEADAPAGGEGRVVLVVEDDPAIRRVTARTLRGEGFSVIEAGSAEEALATPDAVLAGVNVLVTDVVLPGLNGAELAARLTARQSGLRVLYVSGYTDDAISHYGVLDAGVNFLQKPFTPRVLAQRLRLILRGPER